MKATEAKPGKPGTWNGRKQRFRAYARAFKKMDPGAAARVAEKEIAMKERIVRAELLRRRLRSAAFAGVALAGVGVWIALVVR